MQLQVLDVRSMTYDYSLFNQTAHFYGEPFWLRFVKPHLQEIGVQVDLVTLDKIDKTKKWFISLAPQIWTWSNNTGDIISSLPEWVQDELEKGNAYFIMNHECESFTQTFFELFYSVLEKSRLPASKIIYMVGAADAHREYKKFVEKNSIPKERQFEIMETFHVYKHLEFDMREFAVNHAVNKTKKFLSLNRLPKLHRNMLVGLLSHNGLLEHGYVSLGLQKEEYAEAIDYLKIVVPNANPNTYIGLEKIKDQLPLQVDNVDLRINQFGTNSLSGSFYETTCFSLVTSTFALESNEPSVGFTEKEIKPILYEHPFIIYNRPGVLQHLKNMGFMTFGRWFDESYDDEQDDVKRLDKIIAEVKRLSSISFDKWKDMHKEMLPILLHNKNWLIKYNTEHCFFTSDLKNFLHHVT